MKRLLSCAVVMVLVGFAGVQPLEAQRGGFVGFMDFINKLSGPSINGGGASAWVALGGEIIPDSREDSLAAGSGARNRIRVSHAWRSSGTSDPAIAESGKQINMNSVQISYERVVVGNPRELHLAAGLGFARHDFSGDFDDFTNWSVIPIYAQVSVPLGDWLALTFGGGMHSFFEFETTDFNGLTVEIPRDVKEWTLSWGFGLELVY